MRAVLLALLLYSIVTHTAPAFAHGDVMRIGSSQPGGGQILVEPEFVFGSDVFHVPVAAQAGSSTLYSEIFPSFAWILASAGGFHPLSEEVEIDFTVEAPISSGASVRLAGRTLDAPGEAASLGAFENDPEAHVHPEWRLLLANGVTGQYQVSFRLSAEGFSDSPIYTVLITNEEPVATPTATATTDSTAEPTSDATATPTSTPEPTAETTATPTAGAEATETATAEPPATDTPEPTATAATPVTNTPLPTATATPTATSTRTHTFPAPACPGDCDGNGSVSIAELVRAVGLALDGGTEGCAAADANGDGSIAINELIRAVGSALEGCDS